VPGGALTERLQAFVGRAPRPPFRARDPVNQPMIRHWCDAIGDANPVYTEPAAAAASRHRAVVAPPAMLQVWTMHGLRRPAPPPGEDVIGQVFALLDEAGFTSIVATNCEQEYARYLRPGDHLTVSGVIESISDEKRTALGPGHFVTWFDTFRTDEGETVGTMRFRVLKFRPAEPAPARRPRPVVNDDNRFFWEGVERGELLIQRCSGCGELRHPPRPMCPSCRSLEWDAVRASGRGTVHSFVVPHHPRLPAFPEPYVVALIDLEEGTRLVSNLVGVAPADVWIGMPVALRVSRPDGEQALPLFEAAGR
jgi:3-oxo-4,17-pregnadiene-20-carboxyl-CoA hydratase alpha subunit